MLTSRVIFAALMIVGGAVATPVLSEQTTSPPPVVAPGPSPSALALLRWARLSPPTSPATTANAGELGVSCLLAPIKLSDDEVKRFLAAPKTLLANFPNGGLEMSGRVRGLAGSSSAALKPIIGLVPDANRPQRVSIGTGLARTVPPCQVVQIDYATQIQNEVANMTDDSLLTAFAAALNDERVGAIPGAAPGVPAGTNSGAIPISATGQFGAVNNFSIGGSQTTSQPAFDFNIGSAGQYTLQSVSPSATVR